MRGKVGDQSSKTGIAVLALLFAGIICGGVAVAQTKLTGGPSPSPAGAEVYFIDLKDGATVPANLKIYFGLRNMGVAPAGSDRENSGHHHLLIDTELPPLDQPIPNDFNHFTSAPARQRRRLPSSRASIHCSCSWETRTMFRIRRRSCRPAFGLMSR